MDSEVIGGTQQPQELIELEAEFAEITDEFGVDLEEETQEAHLDGLSELDAALAGTEFAAGPQESSTPLSILDIADGNVGGGDLQEGFLGDLWDKVKKPIVNVVKRRASGLIKRLNGLVRKSAKYRSCVPTVVDTVSAFKSGKYGTAVKRAYAAFKCIRANS